MVGATLADIQRDFDAFADSVPTLPVAEDQKAVAYTSVTADDWVMAEPSESVG